jgi:hypothetical protein
VRMAAIQEMFVKSCRRGGEVTTEIGAVGLNRVCDVAMVWPARVAKVAMSNGRD